MLLYIQKSNMELKFMAVAQMCIQTIQNKLMKLLLKLDPKTPTDELHRGMNILKVSDIYKSNVLNFVNEILSGRCPEPF